MRIVIASSGSGGHIFPALSLAQKLKQRNFQIYFVTDKGRIENKIKERGYCLETISATKIDFNSFVGFLKTIIKLIKSFFEALYILKEIKPSVVASFGGYAALPIVAASGFKRIPVIIHEQNVIAGRANRISALFAKKVAVSFKESKKYFNARKVVITGCPVRQELFEARREDALREFNLQADKFTILVMGGSQGSHKINQIFVEAISAIGDISQLQIIHITGMKDFGYVKEAYSKLAIRACCIAFLEKMGYAYRIADLAISRAGASSLAEIINFRIPSILIPYPFAYNHQMANALVLARNVSSTIIEEKDLSAENFKAAVLRLLDKRDTLKSMKENLNRIAVRDAAENLSEVVLSVIKNE